MEFKTVEAAEALPLLKKHFNWLTEKYNRAPGLLPIYQKLLKGDSLILRRRFEQVLWGAWDGGVLVAVLPVLFSKAGFQPVRLGNLLLDPDYQHLGPEILSLFQSKLKQLPMGWMGPLHGHFCLGISIPENPEPDSTFLTAHDWGWDRALLKPLASRTSTLVALRTELDTSTRQKVKQTAVAQCPAEYSIRPFCKWRAKRDAMIYNRLANLSMHHHPDFDSLTPEEDWELLKNSLLAIVPDYFLFLYHKDKPIGFCWGIPDYQEALTGQRSTLGYLAQLLKKSRYHRGRIIYSCILPEYQGQGLCKLIRHRVLNNMIRDGIEVVESSYIHTENENSLSNAQSTGAQLSHRFHYFHGEA